MVKLSEKRVKAYEKGMWAEGLAAMYLTAKGHRILHKRYKTKGGEIDLIALKGRSLLIVEVKARAQMRDALEAVSSRSQKRIEKAALYFISENPEYADFDIRFDVVVIDGKFRLQHLDNAWLPSS